jgi:adenylate cyclase
VARLRDLIGTERLAELKLPNWLKWVASAGITSRDPKVIRRQRFTNVVAYACAANAISHLVINYLHEAGALAPVHLYNAIFAATALCIPRLHRFGDTVAASALALLILLGTLFVVWMLGRESHLQVYFTLAGVLLFMFGVEHLLTFLFWFGTAFVALLASLHLAPPYGVLVPDDIGLREVLAGHAMVNAIIINGLAILYALTTLHRTEAELERQYARSASLVETILPPPIADRLIYGNEQRIADRVENLSVLFADLVGFTRAAHELSPEVVVDYLDDLVREFDALCVQHRIEKIKTIGDSYMAVGGLHGASMREAVSIGRLALAMLDNQAARSPLGDSRLQLRIGIHIGRATAGIIGDTRFSYDVWGDAVNVASRMESYGTPGRIHVSEAYWSAARNDFYFDECGEIDMKGIGRARTYFLKGPLRDPGPEKY